METQSTAREEKTLIKEIKFLKDSESHIKAVEEVEEKISYLKGRKKEVAEENNLSEVKKRADETSSKIDKLKNESSGLKMSKAEI